MFNKGKLQQSETIIKATATLMISDILFNQSHKLPINEFLLTRLVIPFMACFCANKFANFVIKEAYVYDENDPIYKLPAFMALFSYLMCFIGLLNKSNKWVNLIVLAEAISNFHWLYRPLRKAELAFTGTAFEALESAFSFGNNWENMLSQCFADLQAKCKEEVEQLKQGNVYVFSDPKKVHFTLFTSIGLAIFGNTQRSSDIWKYIGVVIFSVIFEDNLNAIIYPKTEQSNSI